ncbi:hypothetical protein JZ751_020568 [Albula glossodonta]|uniref:Uncharacterized protein n=1 Tax=Albula glossodonta TaxID=121402 RepID=A0A8T2PI18_9TELE|nr:hypothetical protein JZ751_020568 [Albula glossodonta]
MRSALVAACADGVCPRSMFLDSVMQGQWGPVFSRARHACGKAGVSHPLAAVETGICDYSDPAHRPKWWQLSSEVPSVADRPVARLSGNGTRPLFHLPTGKVRSAVDGRLPACASGSTPLVGHTNPARDDSSRGEAKSGGRKNQQGWKGGKDGKTAGGTDQMSK